MSKAIDLPSALDEYGPKPFRAVVPAYLYDSSTPAHRLTGVVGAIDGGARFVAVLARDFFDPELARALLEFADGSREAWALDRDIQIIDGFEHPNYGFDSVLFLGPRAHELFAMDSEALNARTVLAVPIFRPEFVGDETAELIDVVRHGYVSTLDWKREPSPRVYLRFNDTAAGYRSTGRKPALETPSRVRAIVSQLTAARGSFAEIRNHAGKVRRLTVDGEQYSIAEPGSGEERRLPRKDILRWLDDFLMKSDAAT